MNTEITKEVAAKVLEIVDKGLTKGLGTNEPGGGCVEAAVCLALGLPHGDDPPCVSRALRSFKIRLNDAQWSSNAARAAGMRRLALIQLGSAGHLDDKEFVRRLAELANRKAAPTALRAAASMQKNADHKAALLEHAVICERDGTRQAALNARRVARRVARDAAAATYDSPAATYAATYAASAAAYATYYAAASASACDAAASAAATYVAASASASACDAAASAAAAYAADSAAAYAFDAASAYAYDADVRDKTLAAFAEDVVHLLVDMKVPGAQWLELAPLVDAS